MRKEGVVIVKVQTQTEVLPSMLQVIVRVHPSVEKLREVPVDCKISEDVILSVCREKLNFKVFMLFSVPILVTVPEEGMDSVSGVKDSEPKPVAYENIKGKINGVKDKTNPAKY